jgi:hypothetical protein
MRLPAGVSRRAVQAVMRWDAQERAAATRASNRPRSGVDSGLASTMVGISSWRLADRMHPQLATLAGGIEAMWREFFASELKLTDLDPRWKYIDSADVDQRQPGAWEANMPKPGRRDYPRLVLENRAYATRRFRSLHLELGWRQDGFQARPAATPPLPRAVQRGRRVLVPVASVPCSCVPQLLAALLSHAFARRRLRQRRL